MASALARDMINTPPNDMGPKCSGETARESGASRMVQNIARSKGGALRGAKTTRPIAAVGQRPTRAPGRLSNRSGRGQASRRSLRQRRLLRYRRSRQSKPASGMGTMKKDMGGAAVMLGLAQMVWSREARAGACACCLPAVENSISGAAFRPLDIYRARSGISVEIGHTRNSGRAG